jgi:hypothetical protein
MLAFSTQSVGTRHTRHVAGHEGPQRARRSARTFRQHEI